MVFTEFSGETFRVIDGFSVIIIILVVSLVILYLNRKSVVDLVKEMIK